MHAMRAAVLVVVTAILGVGLGAGSAAAHYLNSSSVDNYEIRYKGYTVWNDSLNWSINSTRS